MPSAGSLTAVRYLNLTAPKDGTVMVIFNPAMVTQSVVQPERVGVDFRKYAWVGIVTPDNRVCYGYGRDSPKTWDEMMQRKQFILGSTGRPRAITSTARPCAKFFTRRSSRSWVSRQRQTAAGDRAGRTRRRLRIVQQIPQEWLDKGLAQSFVRFTRERPSGGTGKRCLYRHVREFRQPEATPEAAR